MNNPNTTDVHQPPQHPESNAESIRDWPQTFETLLRNHLALLSADEPLTGDASLANLGLDSLATVALLVKVEENYDLQFPDELLTTRTFSTPAALWSAVADLKASQQSAETVSGE